MSNGGGYEYISQCGLIDIFDVSEDPAISNVRLAMEAAGFSESPYVSTRPHGIVLQKTALSKYKKVLSG
jgi:hypothetical protein